MGYKVIHISLIAALCAGCAPTIGNSNLERRVDEQDIQLRQMQPQQQDTWNEVQSMRQEIQRLKEQIAEMNSPGARQANGAFQNQTPADASALSGGGMPISQGIDEPVTGIQPRPGSAPDSSAYAAPGIASASTQTTGLPTPRSVADQSGSYGLPPDPVHTPAVAPGESTWGQADPKPEPAEQAAPAAATPKDLAGALLEAGMNDYKARNYKPAERSFNDFLKNYPSHAKAADAQYYLGECYFAANNYPQAALAFDDVIRKYPKSALLPAAYLKEGIAFSKMGKPDAAKIRLGELIKKYPSSAEAKRAAAFLKTNK